MGQQANRRSFVIAGTAALLLAGCATTGIRSGDAVTAIKKLLGLSSKNALAKLGAGGLADAIGKGSGLTNAIGGAMGDGAAVQVVAIMDQLGLMKGVERKIGGAVSGLADKAAPFITEQIGGLAIANAASIINGQSDSATQLLKDAAASKLNAFLTDRLGASLGQLGVLADLQKGLSLTGGSFQAVDIGKLASSLTGSIGETIFGAIAQEERAIRADPASTGDKDIMAVFGRKA